MRFPTRLWGKRNAIGRQPRQPLSWSGPAYGQSEGILKDMLGMFMACMMVAKLPIIRHRSGSPKHH
jgi:hypothetical protein